MKIDGYGEDPNSLAGMLHRREVITHHLSCLDIEDPVKKLLSFIDYAECQNSMDRNNSNGLVQLLDLPNGLQKNVRALQSSVNATRLMLLEEDTKLEKRIHSLLEKNATYRYRLHAIIMHRGNDGRPNAGHYFVHVQGIQRIRIIG